MAQEDPGLVTYVVGAVAAGVAAIVGWVAKNTVGRIAALEAGKVSKDDFKEYIGRADKSRDELVAAMERQRAETRENVIGLHEKIDDKFDKLADLIRERG